MSLLSLFATVVFASETVISPLQFDGSINPLVQTKPSVSFGQLPAPTIPRPEVLGARAEESSPSVTPSPRSSKKKNYTIAILGDSMADTLGPDLPNLKEALHAYYPTTALAMLNYGFGGTNIDYGLARITHSYSYLGNEIPSLVSQHPDIVIVESFGYNPYSYDEGALDRHWLQLAAIVDIIKKELPNANIVIAATIAPNAKTFGDGALNVSFDPIGKAHKVKTIKSYLENTVRFAESQRLPLADAFHPSLDGGGNGKKEFINQGDHIHYSDEGRKFFSQKITETIIANKLLE